MQEWEFEARLNAHRKLLVQILTMLANDPAYAEMLERYKLDTENVQDFQEDPGVEPDPAFAVRGKAVEELQAMLSAALVRADRRSPSSIA
jgi:hypothetical protein